jgi:ribosomal protein L37AE/L43A
VDSAVLLATLPGDSVTGENLKIVTRLAQSLMKAPAKPESEKGELNCPYCTSRTLNLKTDGSWVCSVCGGTGSLENKNGAFSLKYDPSGDYHFTAQGKIMHAAYMDEKKKLFIATRDRVKEVQDRYRDMNLWVKPQPK